MFDAVAGRYDRLNHILSLSLDRGWRRRTVRHLGVVPGERALDLCCGTGDLALALARAGARVVGADFAHQMLVRAGRKARAIPLLEADAQCLPFPTASFDLLTVGFGLRNLAEPRSGLIEMHRVLRPGGRLGVLEFSVPPSPLFRRAYHLYLRRLVPAVGDGRSGRAGPYHYLADSVRQFPDQRTLAEWIEGAGFEPARWINLTGGIAALHVAVKPGPARRPRSAPAQGADRV